jgi:hypothetical protein
LQLNPITTLYHVAPCCFVFLVFPFMYIELPRMLKDPHLVISVPLLLGSASAAFGACLSHTVCLLRVASSFVVDTQLNECASCPLQL